jgi:hypothetical protein
MNFFLDSSDSYHISTYLKLLWLNFYQLSVFLTFFVTHIVAAQSFCMAVVTKFDKKLNYSAHQTNDVRNKKNLLQDRCSSLDITSYEKRHIINSVTFHNLSLESASAIIAYHMPSY